MVGRPYLRRQSEYAQVSPLALQMFNHHAFISKSAGAPVDWQPLEPVTATIHTFALAKSSPHTHAAMLLLDFVMSERGQRVYQRANYLPSHPKVPAQPADLKPGTRFKRAFPMPSTIKATNGWITSTAFFLSSGG